MRRFTQLIVSALTLSLALTLTSQSAEAQLFDKIARGLGKVNDALEKVEEGAKKVTSGDVTGLFQSKKRRQANADDDSAQTTSESYNSSDDNAEDVEEEMVATNDSKPTYDDSDMEEVEPKYHTPYISYRTKYMQTGYIYNSNFSNVSDGVFTIMLNGKCAFWRVTGEKLFDFEWTYCSEQRLFGTKLPVFKEGVAVARRTVANENGQTPIYLLYLDGSVKELDPTWSVVSEFEDGLAVATQGTGYPKKDYYINIKGEKQFTHLPLYGDDAWSIRPIRDGLRAYPAANYKWGFIDANGVVKITPQYSAVSDFSEGYAWAVVKSDPDSPFSNGELALINTRGEVVFQPGLTWSGSDFKGRYQSIVSDVVNGRFYVLQDDYYNYYNTAGEKIGVADYGSPYYNGLAYIMPTGQSWAGGDICIVDTNFEVVKDLGDGCRKLLGLGSNQRLYFFISDLFHICSFLF